MSTRCNIEFYYGDEPTDGAEPAARIYQHSDGYPDSEQGILAALKKLHAVLAKGFPIYGARDTEPEWAAAEFISMFREAGKGNIYVSQQIHDDIEYLYRVVCKSPMWDVLVFTPKRLCGHAFDIVGFEAYVKTS